MIKNRLPRGWSIKRLQEIGMIITGSTPSTQNLEYFSSEDVCFIKPDDLKEYVLNRLDNSKAYLSYAGAEKSRRLPKGSVVVTCIGIIGKVGILHTDACFNQQINGIVVDTDIADPQYIGYTLIYYKYILESMANAAVVPIVNKSQFSEMSIPLPPLEIQKKIVLILGKAEKAIQKHKEAHQFADKYLLSVFIEMFGDPVKNPLEWKVGKLEDFANIVSGVTKGRNLSGKNTVNVPYLRVANVQDGHLNLREVKEIEALTSDIENYALKDRDVLLTEGGDPDKLGRGTVWRNEIPNCIHQNHIFRVRVHSKFLVPEYLSMLVGSVYGKRYFLKSAKQTTGIATINSKQLKSFPVLLPPLALQEKFSKIAEKIEKIKQKQKQLAEELNTLFNSLMQKAFRGELISYNEPFSNEFNIGNFRNHINAEFGEKDFSFTELSESISKHFGQVDYDHLKSNLFKMLEKPHEGYQPYLTQILKQMYFKSHLNQQDLLDKEIRYQLTEYLGVN